ncbi:MAG: hypothetical protein AB1717_06775 [Pseudomonadota bacterium]
MTKIDQTEHAYDLGKTKSGEKAGAYAVMRAFQAGFWGDRYGFSELMELSINFPALCRRLCKHEACRILSDSSQALARIHNRGFS